MTGNPVLTDVIYHPATPSSHEWWNAIVVGPTCRTGKGMPPCADHFGGYTRDEAIDCAKLAHPDLTTHPYVLAQEATPCS